MARKLYSFGKIARQELLAGVRKLSSLVTATLGPGGRFIVIARPVGNPTSTKDGVTVASDVILEGMEGVGARMALEAASKSAAEAGDGTTSSVLLIYELFSRGLEAIDRQGLNPVHFVKGMKRAAAWVDNKLISRSNPVHGNMIEQVATTSANGDTEIGHNILLAMQQAGRNGVITVTGSKDGETSITHLEGMQFNEGWITPYFVTDSRRMEAILDNPYILLLDRTLASLQGFRSFLDQIAMQPKPLLIIAESIEGEALPTLVQNKQQSVFLAVGVKTPGNLGDKREFLRDLAAYTGAVPILSDLGISTAQISLKMLGQADRVVVTKSTTTIYGGRGEAEKVQKRINEVRAEVTDTNAREVEREKAQERLAKLSGGLTTLSIGAGSEAEMKEKMARVEDAIFSTRCAVAEGILPGGGMALHQLGTEIPAEVDADNESERAGILAVAEACKAPAKLILKNAGWDLDPPVDGIRHGIDSRNGKVVDLVTAGVLDPTKVVRCELANASSIAGVMLLDEAVILDTPEATKGLPI